MKKWYHIFPKNTGLSLYVWLIFCVLPFYFLFKKSSKIDIAIGVFMILMFFLAYRLSFISTNWLVYVWISGAMMISIFMTLFIGYVYFALFLAFFIGNIQNKIGFFILYLIHLLSTISTISLGFFTKTDLFFIQLPFIAICLIGVILLPFTIYNRNKQEALEGLLDDANQVISKLMLMEERQRIARDLHDTLGQKLSLIGLKSDLVGKLISRDPVRAEKELLDIRKTASAALNEVRDLVSDMRSTNIMKELTRVKQILKAAEIKLIIVGTPTFSSASPLTENVLSMCMKEAVTNVVKHSYAKVCQITFLSKTDSFEIEVKDDGIGIPGAGEHLPGSGLDGIRERLEFVNGNLKLEVSNGTTLKISVPVVLKQVTQED